MSERPLRDVIVTWPKSRPLGSYLAELLIAERDGLVVCYRVTVLPGRRPERCYRVHEGHIRGWLDVIDMRHMDDGEVRRVGGGSGHWPAGNYLVCGPTWHELGFRSDRTVMPGFRGWRWFERGRVA